MAVLSDIKLVATDLDGTLLRGDNTVSDKTVRAFEILKSRGVKVAIATGRSWCLSHDHAERIGADGAVVQNGSAVYADGLTLLHIGIDADTIKSVLEAAFQREPGLHVAIEVDGDVYSNFDTGRFWPGRPYIHTDFKTLPDKTIEKIVINLMSVDGRRDFLNGILPDNLYIEDVESEVCVILDSRAAKQNGIKRLAAHFGISMNEVAAFGDYTNDIGMIKECRVGVAMGNATEELKAVADYVCGTNENDGIAEFIEANL